MSVIQWNIRGVRSNHEQMRLLLREKNSVAMCLQETKLGRNSINVGLNYNFYGSIPPPGVYAYGGTAIIANKSLNQKEIHLNTVLQACAIQIFSKKWITLCSLYLDPNLEENL